MELRHLRYFVAVAEELHFGRAARRVRIAQPSLSRQIRDIEEEIGVPLFVRTRRTVCLTDAGSQLLTHARAIVQQVATAVVAAQRASRGETGLLRVTYIPGMVSTRLPAIVRAFHISHPDVTIDMRENWPETQRLLLLRGDVDVGFARGPFAEPSLASEVMFNEPLVVALPVGHALERRRTIGLRALADEPFILPDRSRGAGFHDQVVALCRTAGFSPRAVQEGSYAELVVAVAAGMGVALVPSSMRSSLKVGIVYRPLRERSSSPVVMMWSRTTRSSVVQAFLTVVRRGTA